MGDQIQGMGEKDLKNDSSLIFWSKKPREHEQRILKTSEEGREESDFLCRLLT